MDEDRRGTEGSTTTPPVNAEGGRGRKRCATWGDMPQRNQTDGNRRSSTTKEGKGRRAVQRRGGTRDRKHLDRPMCIVDRTEILSVLKRIPQRNPTDDREMLRNRSGRPRRVVGILPLRCRLRRTFQSTRHVAQHVWNLPWHRRCPGKHVQHDTNEGHDGPRRSKTVAATVPGVGETIGRSRSFVAAASERQPHDDAASARELGGAWRCVWESGTR